MELLGTMYLPNWLLGIVGLVMSVCLYTWYKQSLFRRLGIQSKPTAFFIGDLTLIGKKGFHFVDEEMVSRYGKVFGIYLGNLPTLVVCDTEMIKQIMVKDFNKFTDRSALKVSTLNENALSLAEGNHWKLLRSTLSPVFTSGKLKSIIPYVQKSLKTLHEQFSEKIRQNPDGFDVSALLGGYTLDVICSTEFGLDVNAQTDPDNPFIKYMKRIINFKGGVSLMFFVQIFFPDVATMLGDYGRMGNSNYESFYFFKSTLQRAFEERRQEKSRYKDILQLMVDAHDSEQNVEDTGEDQRTFTGIKKRGLTDDELIINAIIFVLAGYDTTSTVLSWLVYDLVLNPDIQEKMVKEIEEEIGHDELSYDNIFKLKYLDMVLNESLRMHPPSPRITRLAMEDVVIKGIHIKKGMEVQVPANALHYMPEYWDSPSEFNPERFSTENKASINEYAYLPFGIGPRNCIGKRLGLLEVKSAVVSLLQRYRFTRVKELKVPMPISNKMFASPAAPIIVKVEERAS